MSFGIRQLELSQFCQFEHLLLNFEPGLVGVYGPNGAGKSNAINVGAYAAITNDYSRHPLNKPGCIRQQIEEGQSSFVKLVCAHDGGEFTLLRGLKNPENHRLERPGEKPVISANRIAEVLEKDLGINRTILDEYVFIRQGAMFDFMSSRAAERVKSFARLCGTEHAEVCWGLVGEAISRDRDLAAQVVDNSDEIRKRMGQYAERAKVAKRRLRRAKRQMLSAEEVQACEERASRLRRIGQLQASIPILTREEADLKQEAIEANSRWKKAGEHLENWKTKARETREQLDQRKADVAAYRERKKAWERRKELEEELSGFAEDEAQPPTPPCKATGEELTKRQSDLEHEQARCEELLSHAEEDVTECPLCGSKTDKLAERISFSRRRLPEVEQELRKVASNLRLRREYEKSKAEYDKEEARANARIASIQEELKGLKNAKAPTSEEREEAAKISKLAKDLEEYDGRILACDAAVSDTLRAKERRIATHKAKRAELEKAQEELEGLTCDTADAKAAEAQLAEHHEAERRAIKHRAKLTEFVSTVKQCKRDLKQLRRVMRRSRNARKWLKLNERAREILHRDNLPAKAHQAKLEEMEESIAARLREFGSPFRVVAEEGLNLVAHFRNGTVMPATGLSGGQKMMLAICYRLTANPGIMILDEPTDGLDRANRELAADVLTTLGDIAKRLRHQVIVITHDNVLNRAFDQIIEL